ncbi:MAG: sigma-70 family RNA polymerase sigma factor [Bacteroidota bacterium]
MSFDRNDLFLAHRGEGDAHAQRRIFDRWYAYAYTVMLHYVPRPVEAEELTMDAFVRLFEKADRYDPARPFLPWFRRLVVNVALEALRGRLREKPPAVLSIPPVDNEGEHNLEREDIISLLDQLPVSYRVVFNLFVLEEYTHREIAEELGISVGTSKSNLFMARKMLRTLYPQFHAIANSNL